MALKLDPKVISRYYAWVFEEAINKTLDEAKEYAKSISPVLSWEFESNHYLEEAATIWDKVIWALINDTEYALLLEFWVPWKVFNYHRDWSVIFSWQGNRTYTRTRDYIKPILSRNIIEVDANSKVS
jgi:hypothetical protein